MDGSLNKSGWVTFSLIVAVVALFCDFVWCVSLMLGEGATFVVFMMSAFAAIIIVPVFILDFAGFVTSFFSKDSKRRLLMGLSGAGIGLMVLSGCLLINGGVNVEKLEKNYLKHSSEMEQAIDYTLSCLEEGCGLDIEFEGRNRVAIFHICKDGDWSCFWYPSRKQVDSLAAEIGLNRDILNEIHDRLYKADCHSINVIKQDGICDVATIMYRRDMGSAYYYDIHHVAMTEAEMESVDANDCTRIVFNPHVCFVYGSPAFGDIAFPGKQDYLESRQGR